MSAKLDLQSLRVASPCPARWQDMVGDQRTRFCQHCQKHVYNFSALTSKEAEELLLAKEGNLCARLFRRQDGTVITADCPTGRAIVQRQRVQWVAGAVAGLGLLVSTLWLKAHGDEEENPNSEFTEALLDKWNELQARLGIIQRPTLGKMSAPIPSAVFTPPPSPPPVTVPAPSPTPSP
jgi:hypothetical protein